MRAMHSVFRAYQEPWSSRVPNVTPRINAKAVRTLLISSSTLGTDHLRTYPPSKEHFGRLEASRSVPDHPGGSRGSQPVSSGLERSQAVSSGREPSTGSAETYRLLWSRVEPAGSSFGTRDDQGST